MCKEKEREWASLLAVMPDLDVAAVLAAAEEPYTEEELDEFEGELEKELFGSLATRTCSGP